MLLFVLLVAVSLWSLVDAALQPDQAYARAGISKGLVTGMLVLTCVVGALFYWPFIRPRLRRALRLRRGAARRLRPVSDALYLVAGVAILLAALLPSVLSRLAISPPMVLLAAGMAIGLLPVGSDSASSTPSSTTWSSSRSPSSPILLALMGVGLALDRPLRLRRPSDWLRWSATWRLLLVAMPVSIAAVWLLGWWGLGPRPGNRAAAGRSPGTHRPGAGR